ncbi:MAG: Nif3-like dinuclear metal center hexameric protein [Elusimicrobiota bacterium]|jgi:dinuclear metal center YbgI/SA1388 family protein|nr:Nif3-like dinuclear metal center hexameric protein [Elusimicrobiota bacterium]
MLYRNEIISALNKYLNVAAAPEHNGLQVEGKDEIRKIIFGVSAHTALFKAALKAEADMIIVHHGLIWDKSQSITGVFGGRVRFLIKNDINLAAYHLPLDFHPIVGNNTQIAKFIGLKNIVPFGNYRGKDIGFKGGFKRAADIETICKKLNGECLLFGNAKINRAAIVSGGAHDMLEQAADAGVDLFITGSRDEFVVEYCREAKINFIAMGHYNSEIFGVKALESYVKKRFKAQTKFIDIPNPF